MIITFAQEVISKIRYLLVNFVNYLCMCGIFPNQSFQPVTLEHHQRQCFSLEDPEKYCQRYLKENSVSKNFVLFKRNTSTYLAAYDDSLTIGKLGIHNSDVSKNKLKCVIFQLQLVLLDCQSIKHEHSYFPCYCDCYYCYYINKWEILT